MTVAVSHAIAPAPLRHRYLRAPKPLYFPVEERVPETGRHLHARTALFLLVWEEFKDRAAVGSEQFIYWDPTDPKQCCAPDLFVRLGSPHTLVDSWKAWERGAPDLVVEIASTSDAAEGPWDTKLERFRRLGAREIVRFDPEDRDRPIRIWDAVDGDVVERDPRDPECYRCDALGMYLFVREDPEVGPLLRFARDPEGRDLVLTQAEARRKAERRIADLEAELAKRST
jgi:Uma2 family endonuclease